MATEIPTDIFDKLIRNQIHIAQYGESHAKDAVLLLVAASKEIIAKIIGDDTYTQKRLKALLAEIKLIIDGVYNDVAYNIRDEMPVFAAQASAMSAGVLAMQLPTSFSPVAVSEYQLASILSKVPIRIGEKQSLLFDETFKALAGGMEEKVRGAIRLGMIEGESSVQIARRLTGTAANRYKDGILEGSKRQIYNLTHTAVQHTAQQAAALTMEANSEVLNGWIWVATLDSHTCLFCISRSNKEFPLTAIRPPAHIGCRCASIGKVKTFKELGIDMPELPPRQGRASASGVVRADISFDEWLRTQPKKWQVDVLGVTRQKMFENGMKIDKFTNSAGRTLTLAELKAK